MSERTHGADSAVDDDNQVTRALPGPSQITQSGNRVILDFENAQYAGIFARIHHPVPRNALQPEFVAYANPTVPVVIGWDQIIDALRLAKNKARGDLGVKWTHLEEVSRHELVLEALAKLIAPSSSIFHSEVNKNHTATDEQPLIDAARASFDEAEPLGHRGRHSIPKSHRGEGKNYVD